jgi:hypothetical protein
MKMEPPQESRLPDDSQPAQSAAEREDERRKLRRLQIMVGMVASVLSQDPDLTPRRSHELIANCKAAALTMFPDKELAFDLIYKPRLERVARERFGPQD